MKTNEQIFRIIIEDGFSKGNLTVFDKYTSADFIEHQHGIFPTNVEGIKKAVNNLHNAFPDFSLKVIDVVIDGDKVWGRMTGSGTHKNHFGTIPATGNPFEITVIDIMRFSAGKLVEHWGVADRLSLVEQIRIKQDTK